MRIALLPSAARALALAALTLATLATTACGGGSSATRATNSGPLDSGSYRVTAFQPAVGRTNHTGTRVGAGEVLLAGGIDTVNGGFLATAERFRPIPEDFRATAGTLNVARADHTATRLRSGDVLIAGGENNGGATATAEVFDEGSDTFVLAGPMNQARARHTATELSNGLVVIAGGAAGGVATNSIELFDPQTAQFANAGTLVNARTGHAAVLLTDDTVAFVGGLLANGQITDTIEIYDPRPGFQVSRLTANPMLARRTDCTATTTGSGLIIIAGGNDGANGLASIEQFNPVTEVPFLLVGTLTAVRVGHEATTIIDGRILWTGGNGGGAANGDLFDPFDSSVVGAAGGVAFANQRGAGHTATLLSDGSVLIHGGPGAAGNTAELFQTSP